MDPHHHAGARSRRPRLVRRLALAAALVGATAGAGVVAGAASASGPRRRSHNGAGHHGAGHHGGHGPRLPAPALKHLRAKVAKAEAVPAFERPGPAVKHVGSLEGDKVMIIPGTTHIPTCVRIARSAAQLASAVGMKPRIFHASRGSEGWNQGIEAAIHQHYAAVMLECALNPALVAPAIAQAERAGVRVTAYGPTPGESASTKLSAADADPYYHDEVVAVDHALVASKGKPFHALVIQSKDAPSDPIQLAGYKHEMRRYCPACTTTTVNVDVADWSNDLSRTVASELSRHPKVTTIFAFYSGELPYLLSGLEAAHRSKVKSFGTFGQGVADLKLQLSAPGSHVIEGDIAASPVWTGYELFYQTALVLTHQKPTPLNAYFAPNRLATPKNAGRIVATGGFGTAFVNGYRDLLGLHPLGGRALAKAAKGS